MTIKRVQHAIVNIGYLLFFSSSAFAAEGAGNFDGIYGGFSYNSVNSSGTATSLGPTATWITPGVATNYSASKDKAGGQLGYQTTLKNRLLLGVELSYTPNGSSQLVQSPTVPWHREQLTFGDITSLSARIGYAGDSWLVFGKLGNSRASSQFRGIDTVFTANYYDLSKKQSGVNIGLGWEYSVTNNVAVGVEYNSVNWGRFSGVGTQFPVGSDAFTIKSKSNNTSLRVNYLFK